jgi:hypothetical protein
MAGKLQLLTMVWERFGEERGWWVVEVGLLGTGTLKGEGVSRLLE